MTGDCLFVSAVLSASSGQSIHDRLLAAALRNAVGGRFRAVQYGGLSSSAEIRFPIRLDRHLPAALRRQLGRRLYRHADLVHRLDLSLPPGRREVVTIHDLAPLRFPDEGVLASDALATVKAAGAVVAVSDFSAVEIAEWSGRDDVRVIHNGLDPAVLSAPPLPDDAVAKLGIPPGPFVIQSGGATQRKNLSALAHAWLEVTSVAADAHLVLTGASRLRGPLFAGVPRVRDVGELPRAVQLGLVARASVAVVPSLYEGFGLPAIEAMALGVPVVAANCGALPEICADAATLVAPTGEEIAFGILSALDGRNDIALDRGKRRALSFRWDVAAAQYAAVYDEVIG